MITNQVTQNPYSIPPINVRKTLLEETTVGSANYVPTSNRSVLETNVTSKLRNNIPPNYLRQAYTNNQSSSNGSLTESYIRSRASLSPSYAHNEIITRYNMVSAIPMKLIQIRKSFDKIA